MANDHEEQHSPSTPADDTDLTGKPRSGDVNGETTAVPPGAAPNDQSEPPAETPPGKPDRFAVTTYVPPAPEVKFTDRVPRTPEEQAAAHAHRARRRRRRKIIGWTMLGAGVLILASTAWVGWRSYQAYQHLTTASAQVTTLQDQLRDITNVDTAATAVTVADLQAEAADARSAVDDPIFRAATVLPLVGPNLDAIREVTLTVDSLATDVMPSLVEIATTLQPEQLAPTDGAINLEPIERISPLLQNADAAVNEAREQMAAIDRSEVVQPISDAVLTLWRKLDKAAEVTEPGARVARLLPPMLGADGPRTYLVAFQNPAELRATGGIFGSYALIKADQGKITIIDQGASSRTLGYFNPPVAQLPENEIKLYSGLLAQYPADVNLTPNFPTAAPLFAEMYRLRTGSTVDGVMAIDPVALSYMLRGSAGIDVGDGVTVTSDNLVSILLSTAYAKFDGVDDQSPRDAFLSSATAQVFSQMMSGQGDATAILGGLRTAAEERRVLIYSTNEAEQADIAQTGIAGSLDTDPSVPTIGVFLNDGTGAKLGYYLTNEAHVTVGECQPDGRRELKVRVVMHYNPPADGLPAYVTGYEARTSYLLRTNVLVFAPVGGGVVDVQRDGVPIGVAFGQDHSRQVAAVTIELTPGSSTELSYAVLGPANLDGVPDDIAPELVLTPGVQPWVTSVDSYRDCRAPAN